MRYRHPSIHPLRCKEPFSSTTGNVYLPTLLLFCGLSWGCSEQARHTDSEDDSFFVAGSGASSPGGFGETGGSGSRSGGSGGGAQSGVGGNMTSPAPELDCSTGLHIGRAPLRRLTRFEYNNTLEDLLLDESSAGNSLPPELLGNGFGNDADAQPVSSFLVEQYGLVAEEIAQGSLANSEVMDRYAPCYQAVSPATESSCAQSFIEKFAEQAYRRPLEDQEVQELLALQQEIADFSDFETSLSSVVEAILQSPDFLYRVEFGEESTLTPGQLMPTGHEMATRLSFFFWGTSPDEELQSAAAVGTLSSPEGVLAQATRLLNDPRAREALRFFFGKFLPIEGLTDLARDEEQFPTFSPEIGALMREETEAFLEYEIFEGPGDWASALTAPYTFVNETLADFYMIEGVTGEEFRQVTLDSTQRKGLLTQGAMLTGTTVSNFTNPVRRGVFLLRNLLCIELPEPPAAIADSIMPPNPSSGATGRERYAAHSEQAICAGCHSVMDPPGFALENFDAVGLWRDQENGVTIDASGELTILPEPFDGPLELAELIAEDPKTHACFSNKWLTFASGRTLSEEDECLLRSIEEEFTTSGYNIKELLLRITQRDSFLYLPPRESE